MKKIILPLSLITLLIVYNYSCKKAEVDTETQSSLDAGVAENAYSNVFPMVQRLAIGEEGVKQGSLSSARLNGFPGKLTCATINILPPNDTVTNTNNYTYPFEFELDFGTGCADINDGKIRAGKITVSISNYWDVPQSTMTIDLSNYKENSVDVKGTIIVTNNGNNSYTTSLVNGQCIASNWTIEYAFNQTYSWIAGQNTDTIATDDVIQITGSSNGKNRKGKTFSTKIVSPIQKPMNCRWVTKGIFEITPEGLATRTVDFGDGTCDNKATVTINGNTFDFTMN